MVVQPAQYSAWERKGDSHFFKDEWSAWARWSVSPKIKEWGWRNKKACGFAGLGLPFKGKGASLLWRERKSDSHFFKMVFMPVDMLDILTLIIVAGDGEDENDNKSICIEYHF